MKKTVLALGLLAAVADPVNASHKVVGEVYFDRGWMTRSIMVEGRQHFRTFTTAPSTREFAEIKSRNMIRKYMPFSSNYHLSIDIEDSCKYYVVGIHATSLVPPSYNDVVDVPVTFEIDSNSKYTILGVMDLVAGSTTRTINMYPSKDKKFLNDIINGHQLTIKMKYMDDKHFILDGAASTINRAIELCLDDLKH